MKKLNVLYLFSILFSISISQEMDTKLNNSRMGLYISPSINFIADFFDICIIPICSSNFSKEFPPISKKLESLFELPHSLFAIPTL